MISDGFKAHGAGLGPKLGQALASGPTGLARRVELARAREREKVEGLRGPAGRPSGVGVLVGSPVPAPASDGVAERETVGEVGGIEAGAREFVDSVLPNAASAVRGEVAGKVARKMARATGTKLGRPREIEGEPWVEAGVSRRTWERRRKKEAGG